MDHIIGTQRDYRDQNHLLSGQDLEQIAMLSSIETVESPKEGGGRFNRSKVHTPHTMSLMSPRLSRKSRKNEAKCVKAASSFLEGIDGAAQGKNITQKAQRYKQSHGGPKHAAMMPRVFKRHIIEQKVYAERFSHQDSQSIDHDRITTLLAGARSPVELQKQL